MGVGLHGIGAPMRRAIMAMLVALTALMLSGRTASAQVSLPQASVEAYTQAELSGDGWVIDPGEEELLTFDAETGFLSVRFFTEAPSVLFTVIDPQGFEYAFEPTPSAVLDGSYYGDKPWMWVVKVENRGDAPATVKVEWIPDSVLYASPDEDDFGAWGDTSDDTWGATDDSDWGDDWGADDPFAQPRPAGILGMLASLNWSDVLDRVLAFFAQTVFPFLAMQAVQAITVFFVLRYMMQPSHKHAEVETLATPDAPPAGGAPAGEMSFHERLHLDEVSRAAEARRHYKRLRKKNAYSFWWLMIASLVFLPTTLFALGLNPLVGVQAILVVLLYVLFVLIGRPLGSYYATFIALVTAAPLALGATQMLRGEALRNGVMAWLFYVLTLVAIVLVNRWKVSKFAKQDLLVLRVFGMDRTAKETFSTIARGWSWLGASATIADPSYVKYQFAGWRGNLWKFLLVILSLMGATWAYMQPWVVEKLPEGMTEIQAVSILMMVAFVALAPLVIIPIFASVRANFNTSLDKLLSRIQKLMGAKRRAAGYYAHKAFFCHDDLWRPAIHEMMQEAEVVLLDFRGFNPKNLGCAYEVGKVLDTVAIDRAVLLVDEKTEREVLYDIFRGCWAKLSPASPNAGREAPELKVYVASAPTEWSDGFWKWLRYRIFMKRSRQWKHDARGIMALLSTAAAEPLAET